MAYLSLFLQRVTCIRAGLFVLVTVALSIATLSSHSLAWADHVEQRLDEYIAAGEFSAALAVARNVAEPDQRSNLLRQIAIAQNEAGARGAANQTIAQISDDHTRAETLDHILAQRFGQTAVSGQPVSSGGFTAAPGLGGSAEADFDSLIELVTKTIEPESWDEVGGPGSIAEFESGVVVDAAGVLKKAAIDDAGDQLRQLRDSARTAIANRQIRRDSPLRKVSLPRLEKAVQLKAAAGSRPDEAMQRLAGITRIKYVLLYPETNDLVIAGPAGDWKKNSDGHIVSTATGRPVVQLDDLVVVLRQMTGKKESRFGCTITPTKDALARTRSFLAESGKTALKPGRAARERWLEQVQESMGLQDIDVYGIHPGTRVGRVLVEADYRMKLVGMGLEKGTDGVTGYLDSVVAGQATPPMEVLRWWFTINYDAVRATVDRNAFEIRGQGVQVLSENEMLTQLGERVHTGKSTVRNRNFAASFTREFDALSARYPIYAELQNVFDLALVGALLKAHNLPGKADWQMAWFGDSARYNVPLKAVPRQVQSVMNHRVAKEGQIIAGVSGGVRVDPSRLVCSEAIRTADGGDLKYHYQQSPPPNDADRWWWD